MMDSCASIKHSLSSAWADDIMDPMEVDMPEPLQAVSVILLQFSWSMFKNKGWSAEFLL